jgi:hypothetical protein
MVSIPQSLRREEYLLSEKNGFLFNPLPCFIIDACLIYQAPSNLFFLRK